jgi:hypothetical protein
MPKSRDQILTEVAELRKNRPKIENEDQNNQELTEEDSIFYRINTTASDREFIEYVKNYDAELGTVINDANVLNDGHKASIDTKTNLYLLVQQIRNDLMILGLSEEMATEDTFSERTWQVVQKLYKRYSMNGDLSQAVFKSDVPDSTKLPLSLGINSLLKNVDIIFKEKRFYDLYEKCRVQFEGKNIEASDPYSKI